MITSTHLCMAHVMYNYFLKKLNFKLHKPSFMLGNIKPDYYDTDIKRPHILDESIDKVIDYSKKLMNDDLSIKEFSVGLGVICHYICDYFCLYHDDTHKDLNLIEHYFYEQALHLKFLIFLLKGIVNLNNSMDDKEKDIFSMLSSMRDKYTREDSSIRKDITYALSSAIMISERIICASTLTLSYDNKNEIYKLGDSLMG